MDYINEPTLNGLVDIECDTLNNIDINDYLTVSNLNDTNIWTGLNSFDNIKINNNIIKTQNGFSNTLQEVDDTICYLNSTDILTNKTIENAELYNPYLISPIIASNTIVTSGIHFNYLQEFSDTFVYKNTSDILTNKIFGTDTTFSSTQDANMNNSLTGSIISNGGINISKNIYGKNFQTNNGSDINNIISETSSGANIQFILIALSYNSSSVTNTITSSVFYSMQCNSQFNGYVNILTPLELKLSASYNGTASTAFTFTIAVTDLNLVIYKNGSYLSYVPLLMTDTNLYNFTYHGSGVGAQYYTVNLFMSSVSTTFYVDDATNNSTVTYDFRVQATMSYNSVITSPLTSGQLNAYININTTNTGKTITPTNCTLTSTNVAGTNNTTPENLYFNTSCPYSFGTSYTNSVNCNNIKIPSTSDIIKETVNTNSSSSYQSYLTTRDVGVYLVNTATGGNSTSYPLFYSIYDLANRTYQPTTSSAIPNSSSVDGTAKGNYSFHSCTNIDDLYLVYPNYGVICFPNTAWGGTPQLLNYQNLTNNPVIVAPTGPNNTQSVKIYYKGVEQLQL